MLELLPEGDGVGDGGQMIKRVEGVDLDHLQNLGSFHVDAVEKRVGDVRSDGSRIGVVVADGGDTCGVDVRRDAAESPP